jgi:MFS family permease
MSRTLEASPPEVDLKTLRKVIFAASIGNFVEWFDFAAYGFLATILTREFFPSGDPAVGLLKTFAVFAVAFAFRPLGGIVFGVIGDRIGRKRTLALTILMMAGATTLIGLLPTYGAIGALAPFLLTVIRCVQGFSAGGEYAGACAYVMEHAPQHKRASYGSFVPVSTFSSFAVAAIVAYALDASLSADAMSTWGWRVPFLAAAPIGLIGLYLRMNLSETPAFRALEGEHNVAHAPLRDTLRTQAAGILKLGAFISVTALSFYMFTTYFATYLQVAGGLNRATSLLITVIAGRSVFGLGRSPEDCIDGVRHPDRHGLSIVLAGGVRAFFAVGDWRGIAGDWRGVGERGDGAVVVRGVSDTHALYRFGHYLQPGLYGVRRHGPARRHVADHDDGQQHVACVVFDRDRDNGIDRWIDVAGNVEGLAAWRECCSSRCKRRRCRAEKRTGVSRLVAADRCWSLTI